MRYETFTLSEKYPGATLTTYISDDAPELKMTPRQAMVVCPGGGYHFLSDREAEPIVKMFFAAGMNVFLLRYTIKKGDVEGAKDYAPLIEAALSIKHIREHAEEYHIDPAQVFICGFSAEDIWRHLRAFSGTFPR